MAVKGTDKQAEASLNIVDNIVGQIGNVTDEAKASGIFKRWLKYQQSFWRYSAYNVMLLAYQARQYGINLSRVGGSTKWQSHGRKVKGEEWSRRLWILAPVFKKVEDKNGGEKSILAGFRSVYVFDKSQTEGEETPALDYRAHGDDMGLVSALENVYHDQGIALSYVNDSLMDTLYGPECNGVCIEGKTVRVRESVTGAARAGTLAHELAHSMLHFKDDGRLDRDHSRSTAEIEAESVSACVLGAWGLEWQQSAFYLACWGGDKEKVKASMSRIANTSKNILSSILPEDSE